MIKAKKLLSFILVLLCLSSCSSANSASMWARSLSIENINDAYIWKDDETIYLNSEEIEELVQIINSLQKNSFIANKSLAGTTPSYGLVLVCGNEQINISESGYYAYNLEMYYDNRLWWINDNQLNDFIREHSA